MNINFEIIIADDCSEPENKNYLQEFAKAKNYKVIYLEENIGRSKIRNLLIKKSRYNLLLFLDGDSTIDSKKFISKYLENIAHADLLYGGRKYESLPDPIFKLHWLYGTKTESTAHKNFHSNNFIIKRWVLDAVRFDESLTEYGYEDVLFGAMVSLKGFTILKIDNPLIHAQLKDNRQFLKDTVAALKNISYLYHHEPDLLPLLNLSILNFYLRLRKWGFHRLLNLNESAVLNNLYKGLTKNNIIFPLKALILYKLIVLNRILNSNHK